MLRDMTENQLLWRRIAAFPIDDGDAKLPFSRRLARENAWTHEQALAVIEEYRRFVFLAMVAGHPVTPSDEVDQVWHLHLCYTRSYWQDMCGDVLGRPLHHGPTRGGAEEGRKYGDWYRNTLESYEKHFGEKPATQWWPDADARFVRREWRRVDVADAWVVSRRAIKRPMVAAATVAFLVTAAGCSSLIGDNVAGLIAMLAVVGFGFLIWHLARSGGGGGGGPDDGGPNVGGPDVGGTGTPRHGQCGGGDGGGGAYPNHGDDGGGDSGCGGGGCGGGCGE
jgi:hypothetical protein